MPATATKQTKEQVTGVADIDRHAKDQAERKERRDRNRSKLLDCLDAETSAVYEARKPIFEFHVSCETIERTGKNASAKRSVVKHDQTVRAQDADDAWARFCTLIGRYPPPNSCKRKIKKLAQVAASSDGAELDED